MQANSAIKLCSHTCRYIIKRLTLDFCKMNCRTS